MFCFYGSVVEGLKCLEFNDIGDMDIMVFLMFENFIIFENCFEYFLDNLLYVRIKVGDCFVF